MRDLFLMRDLAISAGIMFGILLAILLLVSGTYLVAEPVLDPMAFRPLDRL